MKKGMFNVIFTVLGFVGGFVVNSILVSKTVGSKEVKIDKFKSYYNILNQWLILKQEGKSLEKFFCDKGYKSIAIYGMGELGNRLYEELKDSSLEVKYAIDKNASNTYSELTVYEIEEKLPTVDVIVVSPIFAFDEIEKDLSEIVNYPIISLEDIVFNL